MKDWRLFIELKTTNELLSIEEPRRRTIYKQICRCNLDLENVLGIVGLKGKDSLKALEMVGKETERHNQSGVGP